MKTSIELSVVSPVYQAEATVAKLVEEVREALEGVVENYEIVLVDDGSSDRSWAAIREVCSTNGMVKGVRLSRNFGQHYAITAGLSAAAGERVVVIDCDLQDNPSYIVDMLRLSKQGNDVILTKRETRHHSSFKNWTAGCFWRIFYWLADPRFRSLDPTIGGYSLLTRKVVEAFLSMRDQHRHYLILVRWLGFSTAVLSVEHRPRTSGKSSYNLRRLLTHALNGIVSQSNRLLHLSVFIGFFFFLLSAFTIVGLVVYWFFWGFLAGWASILVTLLFATSLIMISQGVLGIYIGKLFDQAKQRPLYIVDEKLNFESH